LRHSAYREADLQRAAAPRGIARPARQFLPVRTVHGHDPKSESGVT